MRQCLRLLLSGGLVLSLSSTPCEAIGVGLLLDSDSVEQRAQAEAISRELGALLDGDPSLPSLLRP